MEKIVDARGLTCPQPVIKAKEALKDMGEGTLKVLVDNEIAVQNVMKLGNYEGFAPASEKKSGRGI
uniref:sulfurtransferase TusA family protein n=1 Tax=Clostridium sp. NkU-1 TaxID=1095009 RepID=UPI000AF17486